MSDIRDFISPEIYRRPEIEAAAMLANDSMEEVKPVQYAALVKGSLSGRWTAPGPQPVEGLVVVTSLRVIFSSAAWSVPIHLDYEDDVICDSSELKVLRVTSGDYTMLLEAERLELMSVMFNIYEAASKFRENN